MRRTGFHLPTLAVAALALLLLLFGLGSYGLLEDNEARFFEISWEMAQSGDWLTPRLNFIDHFHKPPGTFWLVGGALKLLGPSEWAGRLPVALAALWTAGLTWAWAAQEGSRDQACRAVLVLLTSLEFWFLSRLVLTDMFLTAAVTSALYAAWRSRSHSEGRAWLGFWLSLAAGVMVKGPIILAIVVPVLLVFGLTAPGKLSWNLRPGLGLPLFLALSLPWYVAVCLQHEGLLNYFLRFQTTQRLLTTVHGRPGPWWFYLPVLAAGFFPWSTGLPLTVVGAWRRKDELDRFLLLWLAIPVLFFSCAGSKLPTYLLPVFPALALLTTRQAPPRLRALGSTALVTLALFALALSTYLALGIAPEIQPAGSHLTALALLLGSACLIAPALRSRIGVSAWFAWPACAWAAGLLLLASSLGLCDRAYSARSLAQAISRQQPQGGEIVEVADHLHGLPYYLGRRLIQVSYPRETQFEELEDYRDFLYPDLPAYFASRPADPSTLIIVRRSDYGTYANPAWPRQEIGHWILLRPWPQAAPDLPLASPPQGARPLRGGSGVQ